MATETPHKKHAPRRGPRKLSQGLSTADSVRLCISFQGLNKATKLWADIQSIRESLLEYVGEPTAASEILINRVIFKHLKLSYYEAHVLASGAQLDPEPAYYLNMSNSLRQDLEVLKRLAGKRRPPDLAEYIETIHGDETEETADSARP